MTCETCRYWRQSKACRIAFGTTSKISHCFVEPLAIERSGKAPACRHYKEN